MNCKHYFFSLIFVFHYYLPGYGQQFNLSSKKETEIDNYIKQEMKTRQIPGLALGIYHKGKIIKASAYGLADIQNGGQVKPNTIFELASITKQFTASAIMLLVQESKLSLDDSIVKFLPGAPANWNAVKIKHLLSHSSGLPVIGRGFSGYDGLNDDQLKRLTGGNIPASVAFAMVKTDTLNFQPNDRYTYSDVGYFLLGLIIQNASGMSYRDFMQQRIFDPAELTDTYILDQRTIHMNEARGYGLGDGKLVNIRRIKDFEVPSHYGIFSNLQDLAKWDALLYTNKILSDESKAAMWSPTVHNSGNIFPYGFGWSTWVNNGKKIIDHTGITGTQITRMLDDSVTVVVLTNLGTGAGNAADSWGIGPAVAEMLGYNVFINEKHTTALGAKPIKATLQQLKNLEGKYAVGTSIRKIYLENDKLIYERGKNKNQLIPLNNDRYLMTGTLDEWTIEILPVKIGDPKKLQWYFNGQQNVVMEEVK